MRNRRSLAAAAAAVALMLTTGLAVGFGGGTAVAQDTAMTGHPAHLHSGTCAAPGDVVFPLSDVGSDFAVDGTPTAGAWTGPESAIGVEAGVTTVQAPLADIVSGGHAIVAHESADNIQNYIACGDVGGPMLGASDLPVGLGPLNDSGYNGVAWLHDNGDGTTTVTVFLIEGGDTSGRDMGTPTY